MNSNTENKKVKTLLLLGMVGIVTSAAGVKHSEGFDPRQDPDFCEIDYSDTKVAYNEEPVFGYKPQPFDEVLTP